MARKKNAMTRPDAQLRAGLFGNPAELPDEELNALYDAICPGEDPGTEIRTLASAAVAAQGMDSPLPSHLKSCRRQFETVSVAESRNTTELAVIDSASPKTGELTAQLSPPSPPGSAMRSGDRPEPAIVFASKLADVLLEAFHVSGKTDVEDLCKRLGFHAHEGRFPHFDEILSRDPPSGSALKPRKTIWHDARERFTIAHEMGHLILPHYRKPRITCDPNSIECFSPKVRAAERAANEFATELLMPRKLVEQRFSLSRPTLTAINAVAQDYETSLVVATSCFLSVTREPCAMVISRQGHALWCRSSGSMPCDPSLKNTPVAASMAGRIFAGKPVRSGMEKVDNRLWLGVHANAVQTLFEESVRLREPDTVLTLLWAPPHNTRTAPAEEHYRQSV